MLPNTFPIAVTAHLAGSIVLALFFTLLSRVDARPYLRDWTAAWVAQTLALGALLAAMYRDRHVGLGLHLVLETAHGLLLVAAAWSYTRGRDLGRSYVWLVAPLAIWGGLAPRVLPEFVALEAVQFAILGVVYFVAAVLLWPRDQAGFGLRLTAQVLGLIGLVHVLNAAVFAWVLSSIEAPRVYLDVAPFGILFLQTFLGLGMATAVMEATHEALTVANQELQEARDRLTVLAETDPLTGCFNRRVFRRLVDDLAASGHAGGCVLLLDMDGLKRLNDREGHAAGDDAIRSTANVIKAWTRPSDLAVRWGGDEFVVVMPDLSLPDAEVRRREVLAELDRSGLPASAGVAPYGPGTESDVVTALQRADEAMYLAKAQRRAEPVEPAAGSR